MPVLDETGFDDLMRLQRQLAGELVNEVEIEDKIKLITIIDSLATARRKRIQIESVLIEAQMQGMSERVALVTIDKLKDDGIIAESDPGHVMKL